MVSALILAIVCQGSNGDAFTHKLGHQPDSISEAEQCVLDGVQALRIETGITIEIRRINVRNPEYIHVYFSQRLGTCQVLGAFPQGKIADGVLLIWLDGIVDPINASRCGDQCDADNQIPVLGQEIFLRDWNGVVQHGRIRSNELDCRLSRYEFYECESGTAFGIFVNSQDLSWSRAP